MHMELKVLKVFAVLFLSVFIMFYMRTTVHSNSDQLYGSNET